MDLPVSGAGRRMARTFVSLVSAEVLTRAFAFLAAIVVVRALAPSAFGAFAYALALASVLGLGMDLGFPALLMRDASARPAQAATLLGRVLRLELLLGVGLVAVASLAAWAGLVPGPAGATALTLAFAGIVGTTLGSAFEAALTASGKAHLVTVSRAVRSVLLIAGSLVVAAAAPGVVAFLLAWLVAESAGAATAAVLCAARAVAPRLRGSGLRLGALLRTALPFALLAGFNLLYIRIDIIMLGLLGGRAAVGNYAVAARVLEAALIVPVYFGSAFLATVAHGNADAETMRARTVQAVRYLLLACVPLAFVLACSGDALVTAIAGSRYHSAGEIFVRLTPIIALAGSYYAVSSLQIALDRTATLVRINLAGVLLKLVLNAGAIPAFGAFGAAAAAVIGEAVVVVCQWYAVRGELDVGRLLRWSARLAVATAAMVAGGLLLVAALSWPFALVGGLAAFAILAWRTGCISAIELRTAWAAVAARST